MASELIKKFDEIQEKKHGKKEIQVDEFEWIEVNKIRTLIIHLFLTKKTFFGLNLITSFTLKFNHIPVVIGA